MDEVLTCDRILLESILSHLVVRRFLNQIDSSIVNDRLCYCTLTSGGACHHTNNEKSEACNQLPIVVVSDDCGKWPQMDCMS